jgi:hypothetical protein
MLKQYPCLALIGELDNILPFLMALRSCLNRKFLPLSHTLLFIIRNNNPLHHCWALNPNKAFPHIVGLSGKSWESSWVSRHQCTHFIDGGTEALRNSWGFSSAHHTVSGSCKLRLPCVFLAARGDFSNILGQVSLVLKLSSPVIWPFLVCCTDQAVKRIIVQGQGSLFGVYARCDLADVLFFRSDLGGRRLETWFV